MLYFAAVQILRPKLVGFTSSLLSRFRASLLLCHHRRNVDRDLLGPFFRFLSLALQQIARALLRAGFLLSAAGIVLVVCAILARHIHLFALASSFFGGRAQSGVSFFRQVDPRLLPLHLAFYVERSFFLFAGRSVPPLPWDRSFLYTFVKRKLFALSFAFRLCPNAPLVYDDFRGSRRRGLFFLFSVRLALFLFLLFRFFLFRFFLRFNVGIFAGAL